MTAASKSKPRELPILMAGDMARAAWDGTKTQTRRDPWLTREAVRVDRWCYDAADAVWFPWDDEGDRIARVPSRSSPYGKRGDLLFVKETWWRNHLSTFGGECDRGGCGDDCPNRRTLYRASSWGAAVKWSPAFKMPKRHARTWLEILDVRVERVSEISEEDAKAEACAVRHLDGIECGEHLTPVAGKLPCSSGVSYSYRECFAALWNDLYAPKGLGWDASPWVWVYSFRKLEGRP